MDELDAASPSDTEVELPPGYDDVDEFLKEARTRFREGADADRENREAGLDDLKFLAGEQWDPTVKAQRKRARRPTLVINDLPQYIGQVIGDTRINRPAIKVRPVEDADEELAEIRAGLIRSPFDISDVWQSSYSSNTNEILWGAKLAARCPWITCVIRLSSYECGMDQPTYTPTQKIIEASGTLFFKFGDLDATKPAGSIKIRVETIVHYVEKYSPDIIRKKLSWLPEPCPLIESPVGQGVGIQERDHQPAQMAAS